MRLPGSSTGGASGRSASTRWPKRRLSPRSPCTSISGPRTISSRRACTCSTTGFSPGSSTRSSRAAMTLKNASWRFSTSSTAGTAGRTFRGCAFINTTVELAEPDPPRAPCGCRPQGPQPRLLPRAGRRPPASTIRTTISDQWMLLSEGATITALVEDDRDAARRARSAAGVLLATAKGQAAGTSAYPARAESAAGT